MMAFDRADTAFMLLCAALVLLMTPGLAFFYGGLVRSKNVVNTMMMSFIALIRRTIGIRSEQEHEYEGLDLVEHGERAYHEIV